MVMHLPAGIEASISGTWKKRMSEEAYTLIDVSVRKEISLVGVYIKAQNVLNAPYQEIIGVPQPGRWVWGGVEITLK